MRQNPLYNFLTCLSACDYTYTLFCMCVWHHSLLYVCLASEYSHFYRALLQKRPIIWRSPLIVATPYQARDTYVYIPHVSVSYIYICGIAKGVVNRCICLYTYVCILHLSVSYIYIYAVLLRVWWIGVYVYTRMFIYVTLSIICICAVPLRVWWIGV